MNRDNKLKEVLPIHVFKYKEENYLYDISTSVCFKISKLVYDAINEFKILKKEGYTEYALKECPNGEMDKVRAKIDELKKKGFLKETDNIEFSGNEFINGIELNATHKCNMNCIYCYGNGGNYGMEECIMTEEIARKSIDFLFNHCGSYEDLYIVFFGGEPLINFDIIKSAVIYAKDLSQKVGKNISFSITTNGTIINQEILNFIRGNDIKMQISMDGCKQIQDYLRPLRDNRSSYDTVVANINKFKYNESIGVRSTLTKLNLDVDSIFESTKDLKFKSCYVTPVSTDNQKLQLTAEDYNVLKLQFSELAERIIRDIQSGKKTSLNYIGNFTQIISSISNHHRRTFPCGAGNKMLCITPNGDVYPCHRFAGNEDFLLGNIGDGLLDKKRKVYLNSPVQRDKKCRVCWAKYICSGGCWKERIHNKEISFKLENDHYCSFFKYICELCIVIYHELMKCSG